jgi:hypothetical protein
MKRFLVMVPIIAAAFACGGGGPAADPTELTQPIAQNVTISQITILQGLEIPVMENGSPANRQFLAAAIPPNPAQPYDVPLIAQRESILRVYVSPEAGYSPHPLTARVRIVTPTPMGTQAVVYAATATISTPSQQFDLTSTINVTLPYLALERGSSITVVLNDKTGDAPSTASSNARWPQDGSLADIDVRDGSDKVRIMIVPVQYDADGSHRVPDTSDAQIESYRQRFYQVYPAAQIEITVRDPWPWSQSINGGGAGMNTLLNALPQLRSGDGADPDLYYYAAFDPTADFGAFCGGGCITGLSNVGSPNSVGVGYAGAAEDTAIHEVGHAHGLDHAPCGGVSGTDQQFPYPDGSIGFWGYDPFAKKMIDPTVYKDMMSYCDPKWISDYFYQKVFRRVRTDNKYFNDWMPGPYNPIQRFTPVEIDGGSSVILPAFVAREKWITLGEPREITWAGGKATAYFFPYDHLPGGTLYVPEEVPSGAQLRGETITTILR